MSAGKQGQREWVTIQGWNRDGTNRMITTIYNLKMLKRQWMFSLKWTETAVVVYIVVSVTQQAKEKDRLSPRVWDQLMQQWDLSKNKYKPTKMNRWIFSMSESLSQEMFTKSQYAASFKLQQQAAFFSLLLSLTLKQIPKDSIISYP